VYCVTAMTSSKPEAKISSSSPRGGSNEDASHTRLEGTVHFSDLGEQRLKVAAARFLIRLPIFLRVPMYLNS
jgi:hypothetical protein